MKYIKKFNETLSGGYLKVPENIYDPNYKEENTKKEPICDLSDIGYFVKHNNYNKINKIVDKCGVNVERGIIIRYAATYDNIDLFKYLLNEKGADLYLRRSMAIMQAFANNSKKVIDYLVSNKLIKKDEIEKIKNWIDFSDGVNPYRESLFQILDKYKETN